MVGPEEEALRRPEIPDHGEAELGMLHRDAVHEGPQARIRLSDH